jgi:protein-tyrosine phosphatase
VVPELPAPRDPAGATYVLALVCLGNICRSPMAHVVLERKLERAETARRVVVESSGTGNWHLGEPMDA